MGPVGWISSPRRQSAGMSEATPRGEMLLYQVAEGAPTLEVRLERETVWLSLSQIAELFERDKSVISRHLRNVFASGELEREATVAKYATVQAEGPRQVVRAVEYFNLDAILSVGYRVNSKRGTQFRIWATRVLREHLVRGYTVNARRLKELRQAVRLVADVAERRELSGDEAKAVLRVVSDYAYALDVLDDYDHQRVQLREVQLGVVSRLSVEEARRVVVQLRDRFGGSPLFGRRRTPAWKDRSPPSSRPSAATRSIRASRRRRPTCSTS